MSLASSLCQAAILAALVLVAAESVNGMPHTAAGRLHTLRPSASEAKQLSGRSPDPADSAFQNSLHLSAALAGMVVLIVLEYSVHALGYVLSRSWWRATDSILWILMGLISATWTTFIFLSAYIWEGNSDNPCSIDPSGPLCATRLAFAPWILNGVFLWWCVRLALYRIRRLIYGGAPMKPGALIRKRWKNFKKQNKWFIIHRIPHHLMAFLEFLVWALAASAVVWTAVGAFRTQLFTLGMLLSASTATLLGRLMFPIGHLDHEHCYAMDDIRIPLHSPVEQGIVYILPSGKYGFDATYSQTLDSEQKVLDANLKFFDPHHLDEDWTLKKCRVAAQDFIESQIKKIVADGEMIKDLAFWLHWHRRGLTDIETAVSEPIDSKGLNELKGTEENKGNEKKVENSKAKTKNPTKNPDYEVWRKMVMRHPLRDRGCKMRTGCGTLIGRDLVLALLLWEYLVFERRWQLQVDCEPMLTVPMVWRLRDSKHSGAVFVDNGTVTQDENSSKQKTMGSSPRLAGFLEAVGEVYRIVGVVGEEGDGDIDVLKDGDTRDSEKACPMRQESVSRKEDTNETNIARSGQDKTEALLKSLEIDKLPKPSVVKFSNKESDGNSDEKSKAQFSSFEDYAGKLWDKCWAEYPSTFGALYLWTTVWYIDVGNIGFHTTPLVPHGGTGGWVDNDYATTWRIPWRGLWHATVRCQVVVLLPTLIGSFSGLLATL